MFSARFRCLCAIGVLSNRRRDKHIASPLGMRPKSPRSRQDSQRPGADSLLHGIEDLGGRHRGGNQSAISRGAHRRRNLNALTTGHGGLLCLGAVERQQRRLRRCHRQRRNRRPFDQTRVWGRCSSGRPVSDGFGEFIDAGAVAFVVMVPARPGFMGSDGCAVQRLALGLLIEAEHHRPRGWIQVQTNNIDEFLLETRVVTYDQTMSQTDH